MKLTRELQFIVRLQPCRAPIWVGGGVKMFRGALTLLVKQEGTLLGQRAHTNSDLQTATGKPRTTSQRCIALSSRFPPTQRVTFIPSTIDEKSNHLFGGFAVAITS
jgi:hypothetical protein